MTTLNSTQLRAVIDRQRAETPHDGIDELRALRELLMRHLANLRADEKETLNEIDAVDQQIEVLDPDSEAPF